MKHTVSCEKSQRLHNIELGHASMFPPEIILKLQLHTALSEKLLHSYHLSRAVWHDELIQLDVNGWFSTQQLYHLPRAVWHDELIQLDVNRWFSTQQLYHLSRTGHDELIQLV